MRFSGGHTLITFTMLLALGNAAMGDVDMPDVRFAPYAQLVDSQNQTSSVFCGQGPVVFWYSGGDVNQLTTPPGVVRLSVSSTSSTRYTYVEHLKIVLGAQHETLDLEGLTGFWIHTQDAERISKETEVDVQISINVEDHGKQIETVDHIKLTDSTRQLLTRLLKAGGEWQPPESMEQIPGSVAFIVDTSPAMESYLPSIRAALLSRVHDRPLPTDESVYLVTNIHQIGDACRFPDVKGIGRFKHGSARDTKKSIDAITSIQSQPVSAGALPDLIAEALYQKITSVVFITADGPEEIRDEEKIINRLHGGCGRLFVNWHGDMNSKSKRLASLRAIADATGGKIYAATIAK